MIAHVVRVAVTAVPSAIESRIDLDVNTIICCFLGITAWLAVCVTRRKNLVLCGAAAFAAIVNSFGAVFGVWLAIVGGK